MNKNIQSLINHIRGECYTPTSIVFYENFIMYDFTIIYTRHTHESKFDIKRMIPIKNCNDIRYNTCVSNVISLYKHYLMTFNMTYNSFAISEYAIYKYVKTKNKMHVFDTCIIATQVKTMYDILINQFPIHNRPNAIIVN